MNAKSGDIVLMRPCGGGGDQQAIRCRIVSIAEDDCIGNPETHLLVDKIEIPCKYLRFRKGPQDGEIWIPKTKSLWAIKGSWRMFPLPGGAR